MSTSASGKSGHTAGKGAIIFELVPLPDFLEDHTLMADQPGGKLSEVLGRWVQLVGALWRWHDGACFVLRYTNREDRVRLHLIARPFDPQMLEMLKEDLAVLLKTHGIPFLPAEWQPDDAGARTYAEVRQYETDTLWKFPDRLARSDRFLKENAWLPRDAMGGCRVVFPWWAPGGPFLLPLEKLMAQCVPVTLSIFLQPTALREAEQRWLGLAAREAESGGEQQEQGLSDGGASRRSDPMAKLVGRLHVANLRRLTDKPFLVSVLCAAPEGTGDVARSLAGAVESLVYESPFDYGDRSEEKLPSAASVVCPEPGSAAFQRLDGLHRGLDFGLETTEGGPLARMPYLADARGAATVFRLPISVRGGVPGMAVVQRTPDFHPGPRHTVPPPNALVIGHLHQGGVATMPVSAITKHALITGFTGSGKTMTLLHLLHQIHEMGIPVLVIESAKQEFRGLLGVESWRGGCGSLAPLRIYTAGHEMCAPLRMNPFEILPGVRVETHISRLQTCFEAALPPIGPLTSMISEALVDVYAGVGWRHTDEGPQPGEIMPFRFPRMGDFSARMEALSSERGYEGEVLSNVRAAVLGRLKPLSIGTKGCIFRDAVECVAGLPRPRSAVAALFEGPVVLELNDLNIDDKALLTMFLLTFLREHRDRYPSLPGRVAHITVVEEAHNLLENVKSSGGQEGAGADTRYKAVQAFSQLLSEVRALGEGIIIADQSPEKLAPDAMRNTNLQIAHQLRDSHDREAIARAMIMDDEQRDYLGKLLPGEAALFMTGMQKATFVKVPAFGADGPGHLGQGYRRVSDAELRAWMDETTRDYREGPFGAACAPCRSKCNYRSTLLRHMVTGGCAAWFDEQRRSLETGPDAAGEEERVAALRIKLVREAARIAVSAGHAGVQDAAWCAFLHGWMLGMPAEEETMAGFHEKFCTIWPDGPH